MVDGEMVRPSAAKLPPVVDEGGLRQVAEALGVLGIFDYTRPDSRVNALVGAIMVLREQRDDFRESFIDRADEAARLELELTSARARINALELGLTRAVSGLYGALLETGLLPAEAA